jgi:oxygen-independent coproporphyrinogen III oxidase
MKTGGIYIHIPFCRSRCSYCDFATGSYDSNVAERYVQVLVKEIESFNLIKDRCSIDTVYFGGGTPSLLQPNQVAAILDAIYSNFHVIENREITMEMNPGTVSPNNLREFHKLGINRASFGLQTFNNKELRSLGRVHTVEEAIQTFNDLQEVGFTNISFDLIAGLPKQTLEDWIYNLDQALTLRPKHISLYMLDVHEGTPLAEQIKRGQQPKPNEDLAAEMYQSIIERTKSAGYIHYEISNFSLPGYESRHNTKYWIGDPYYGFGCSSHSYDGEKLRWSNERDVSRYINAIEDKGEAIVERVELTKEEAQGEAIFLGLRLMEGVDLNKYQARFGINLRKIYADELSRLEDAGLLTFDNEIMKLTRTGILLSNEVFSAFI